MNNPETHSDDGALVRRVLAGDREAFRGLVEKYQGRVYHAVHRIVRDPDEAEDLAQETFVKAYTNLARYDGRWAFSTWLTTIANRTALNAARKRRNQYAVSFEDLPGGWGEGKSREKDPAQMAGRNEWLARLKSEIDALGDKMRVVFGLRYEEDLPVSEIARITRSTQSAVKVTLHRARKILRQKLKEFSDLV